MTPEEHDLIDLFAESLERPIPHRTDLPPVELPDEPEALAEWRRVAAYRDLLVRQITSWERFWADQRRGQERLDQQRRDDALPPISEASREARDHSDKLLQGTIDDLRADLDRLDRDINGLKQGALSKLTTLARTFKQRLEAEALRRVEMFVAHPDSRECLFLATMSLLHARDGTPRALDDEAAAAAVRVSLGVADCDDETVAARVPVVDFDLRALLEEARIERKNAELGQAQRAPSRSKASYIVGRVLGVSPNSSKFRRI